jgi:hypothetical protein
MARESSMNICCTSVRRMSTFVEHLAWPQPRVLAYLPPIPPKLGLNQPTVSAATPRGPAWDRVSAPQRLMTPAAQYCARIGNRKVHHSRRC